MADPGHYTKEEFAKGKRDILGDILSSSGISPRDDPRAFLLGGQSGAGKTLLHSLCKDRLCGNAVIVNGDEFRSYHPRYIELDEEYGPESATYTVPWAGRMTESLIDSFSSLRYNLVIEGTLRTAEVPLRAAEKLRKRGYDVSLALMAVKPEISLISCRIRYEEMRLAGTVPRATDPAHHRAIVDAIAGNLSVLEESGAFSRIELYSRAGTLLYPVPEETRTASAVLQELLFGAWSAEERSHLQFLEQRLVSLRSA